MTILKIRPCHVLWWLVTRTSFCCVFPWQYFIIPSSPVHLWFVIIWTTHLGLWVLCQWKKKKNMFLEYTDIVFIFFTDDQIRKDRIMIWNPGSSRRSYRSLYPNPCKINESYLNKRSEKPHSFYYVKMIQDVYLWIIQAKMSCNFDDLSE